MAYSSDNSQLIPSFNAISALSPISAASVSDNFRKDKSKKIKCFKYCGKEVEGRISEEIERRLNEFEEELSKLSGLSERVREEVEELRSENADLRRRKEEMEALIDSFREEDVFFDGITKEDARLREMDYVKRVEGRLK